MTPEMRRMISENKVPHIHFRASANLSFDIVIFAVKAFQVQSAFTQIKPFLSPSSVLVVSHNGMGNVETLNEQLDKQQALYFLTTSMAGFKTNDFIVQHTGEGKSVLGACNPCAHSYRQAMCEQLQNSNQGTSYFSTKFLWLGF